jgi:hypothetical protein
MTGHVDNAVKRAQYVSLLVKTNAAPELLTSEDIDQAFDLVRDYGKSLEAARIALQLTMQHGAARRYVMGISEWFRLYATAMASDGLRVFYRESVEIARRVFHNRDYPFIVTGLAVVGLVYTAYCLAFPTSLEYIPNYVGGAITGTVGLDARTAYKVAPTKFRNAGRINVLDRDAVRHTLDSLKALHICLFWVPAMVRGGDFCLPVAVSQLGAAGEPNVGY